MSNSNSSKSQWTETEIQTVLRKEEDKAKIHAKNYAGMEQQ